METVPDITRIHPFPASAGVVPNHLHTPFPSHTHTDLRWQCTYMAEGESRIVFGGKEWRLGPGEALLTLIDHLHGTSCSSGRCLTVVFCNPALTGTSLAASQPVRMSQEIVSRQTPLRILIAEPRQPHMEQILALFEGEARAETATKCLWCGALSYRLFRELAINARSKAQIGQGAGADAKRLVAQFCAELSATPDYPWTIAEMARRTGYSPRQLSRMFGEVTALSPHQWLLEERLRLAQVRLARTDDRITDVAVEFGFGGRRQFRRAFQTVVGLSPSQYRAVIRERPAMA